MFILVSLLTGDFKLATPLLQEEVTLLHELHERSPKTLAPDGIMNIGVVVSIVDPGEFYIIPYDDWSCACSKPSVFIQEGSKTFKINNI